jgi:hypothetical protein
VARRTIALSPQYLSNAAQLGIVGGGSVHWSLDVMSDWLATCVGHRIATPDLSSASGWDDAWGFADGNPVTMQATVSTASNPLSDGDVAWYAQQSGMSATP